MRRPAKRTVSSTAPNTAASPAPLRVARDGDVLIITLTRAHKRNALSDELVRDLAETLNALPDGVKALVLHGEGGHFSAGLDLDALKEATAIEGIEHSRMWHACFDRLYFGRVPVIAVLTGAVIGGGLELACSAHLRVAERGTFYALPEGQRGLFVGGGGSVRIARTIGVPRMTDLMLTGRVYDADEGHQAGLSQYLADQGQGMDKAMELAQKIAGNASFSNYAIIQALPRIANQSVEDGLFLESMVASISQSNEEAKLRMRAFLDKRAGKVKQ